MSKRRFMLAAALGLLLGACAGAGVSGVPASKGGGSDAARPVAPGAVEQTTVAAQPAPVQQGGGGILGVRFQSDRVLVLSAQLQFKAPDPWSTADRVQSIAFGLGGDVVGVSQVGHGDDRSATVTIRVPNERFNDALAQIKGLSDVELLNAQVTGEDRTEQFIDLDARLKAKQAEEARYLALLARAEKIDDILKIDQVLGSVRAQIEQLQGQLNALKNRSSMATITAAIVTAAPLPTPLDGRWQPAKTFQAATAALARLLQTFGDLAIWALVWIWVPAFALGLLFALSRVRIRPARP